ncbi:MAG: hypothetical protein ACOY46_05505 [Bacillota bacterium]
MDKGKKQHIPIAVRFENPIIKVSVKKGVITSRVESFWSEQTIKVQNIAANQ